MGRFILTAILLTFAAAGLCYYWLAPSQADKRRAQELLDTISGIVETQDRAQIQTLLASVLSDSAQVTLEMDFPAPRGQKSKEAEAEKFNRDEFLHFVDNTLYTVSGYHFKGSVQKLSLKENGTVGDVDFTGRAEASGSQMDGNLRFIGDIACSSTMPFRKDKPPEIDALSCVVQMHYAMQH